MRQLKMTLILGSCLTLTGCSSIWSGVSDFADLMSEKTEFLSLRKSSSHKEVVNTHATPDYNGTIQSSAGYYVPATTHTNPYTYTPTHTPTHIGGHTSLSSTSCPDGAYLTAENTCMMMESPSYEMSELRGMSTTHSFTASPNYPSTPVDCPSGTYLTAENTCMQSAETTVSLAGGIDNSYSPFSLETLQGSLTGPLICPEGMILDGAYDCRFEDSLSMSYPDPITSTSAISYGYEISCPVGSYKDPENICMRQNVMP